MNEGGGGYRHCVAPLLIGVFVTHHAQHVLEGRFVLACKDGFAYLVSCFDLSFANRADRTFLPTSSLAFPASRHAA